MRAVLIPPSVAARRRVPGRAQAMLRRVLRCSRALRTWRGAPWPPDRPRPVRHRLRLRLPVGLGPLLAGPRRARLRRSATRLRDAGIYALQMWAYLAHYDMPDDDPDAAAGLKVDYPMRSTACSVWGSPPRFASSARSGARAAWPLDYGLSVVHWSWFLVPHGTLRLHPPEPPRKFPAPPC